MAQFSIDAHSHEGLNIKKCLCFVALPNMPGSWHGARLFMIAKRKVVTTEGLDANPQAA